jgi:hypothetical protein
MSFIRGGTKSKGICYDCRCVVDITFRKGTFTPSEGRYKGITFEDLLLGYCDICGELVALPHESTLHMKKRITE